MMIKTALIIDDSKFARLILTKLLKEKNIKVVEAESAKKGLEELGKKKTDMIFLDVMMPEIGGLECLSMLKTEAKYSDFKEIPVVMYSSELDIKTQQEAISKGACAYLFKPVNGKSLDYAIEASERIIKQGLRGDFIGDEIKTKEFDDFKKMIADFDSGIGLMSNILKPSKTKMAEEKEEPSKTDIYARQIAKNALEERQKNRKSIKKLEEKIEKLSSDVKTAKKFSSEDSRRLDRLTQDLYANKKQHLGEIENLRQEGKSLKKSLIARGIFFTVIYTAVIILALN